MITIPVGDERGDPIPVEAIVDEVIMAVEAEHPGVEMTKRLRDRAVAEMAIRKTLENLGAEGE